ncbi:MAG TPA: O-antigen ligase family protein [Desulfobacteraceae bacterium]|nr:O-antigen ligase family protein [Desulfobacteraceae bacterium]HPJ66364.1 O-antigen ligase family protein [Desulfobacteraceae bacterium]HPQ27208.1 O-antigen ligase family protein [Desulfobacteraceae bacterium]
MLDFVELNPTSRKQPYERFVQRLSKFKHLASIYILIIFFIPNAVSVLNVPGIPLISIKRVYIVLWFLIFLLLLLGSKKMVKEILAYPFLGPIAVVLAASLLVTFFADNFMTSLQRSIALTADTFLPAIIIWASYKKHQDIANILNLLITIFVVISLYGIFAYTVSHNPVLDFVNTHFLSESDRTLIYTYEGKERFGMVGRAQSIFAHPIQYGCFLVVMMFVTLISYSKQTLANKSLKVLGLAVMTVALFQTNSRSPLAFAFAGLGVFWFFKGAGKKAILICLGGLAAIFILAYTTATNNNAPVSLLVSLFQELSGSPTEAGGSSLAMRLNQFRISALLFSEHPVVGHGLATVREMIQSKSIPHGLAAAESFLFILMIEAGLVGILAYIFFFYKQVLFFLKTKHKSKNIYLKNISIICLSVIYGYLAFILMTGIVGTLELFIIITTLFARYIYLKSKEVTVFRERELAGKVENSCGK